MKKLTHNELNKIALAAVYAARDFYTNRNDSADENPYETTGPQEAYETWGKYFDLEVANLANRDM